MASLGRAMQPPRNYNDPSPALMATFYTEFSALANLQTRGCSCRVLSVWRVLLFLQETVPRGVCVLLCVPSGGPRCSGAAKRPKRSSVRWLRCACAMACLASPGMLYWMLHRTSDIHMQKHEREENEHRSNIINPTSWDHSTIKPVRPGQL